ncbi:hypothetical protein KKG24_01460 [Patescibacteria group bacterium]|nr:hypothetical protein [Patescibacteria group bacterium]
MFFWSKKPKKLEQFDALKLKEQIEKQVEILQRIGILENPLNGKILGIDNKEYNIPTLPEILQRLENKKELVKKKIEQGFTKVILVPFACPLEKIIRKYEETIIAHNSNSQLLATKEKESDMDERLELDLSHPVNIWSEYKDGDIKNNFVYFPETYDEINHKGKTKLELLSNPKNAWQIFLIENLPNLPSVGKGKTIGHRKQIETEKTPVEYLKMLHTNKAYQGEEGLNPEAELIYAITYLEETNQIINDWQGKGNISYELGAFLPSSNSIPWLSWDRDFKRADLWKLATWSSDPHTGARVGIRI